MQRYYLKGGLAFQICFLCLIILMLSESATAQKIFTTNRLTVLGDYIGLYVSKDTTVKTIKFYQDSVYIGILDSSFAYGAIFSYHVDKDGWRKYWAKVYYRNSTMKKSDTTYVFVATVKELNDLVNETITYQYKSQTFPDSAIVLPEHALILGYTHYTTFKTMIKYLNPIF